jgi:hypothetical protein
MKTSHYFETAAYFERRAAKAQRTRRRSHLASVAKLYRDKAREAGMNDEPVDETSGPIRRERVAAMFRAWGDPASIAKSRRTSDSEPAKP